MPIGDARPDQRAHAGGDLAVGVGVLLGDGRAVLGQQDAVPAARCAQAVEHLATMRSKASRVIVPHGPVEA